MDLEVTSLAPGAWLTQALDAVGDGLLDGGGRHPLVVGDDLHGGRLERRENVDADVQDGQDPQEEDHEDDRRHHVGIAQRRLD